MLSTVYIPDVLEGISESSNYNSDDDDDSYDSDGGIVMAQLLPPYTAQRLMERQLQELVKLVPGWVSEDCYGSLRRMMCASKFLKPWQTTLSDVISRNGYNATEVSRRWTTVLKLTRTERAALLQQKLYVPSYPDRSVCTEYVSKCSAFAERLLRTKGLSTFVANCEKVIEIETSSADPLNVTFFPLSGKYQHVRRMHLLGAGDAGSISMDVSSKTGSMGTVILQAFTTTCPHGFVVPDDKMHPRNHWQLGTGCAEACRSVVLYHTKLFCTD
jgi:hypothetical protein